MVVITTTKPLCPACLTSLRKFSYTTVHSFLTQGLFLYFVCIISCHGIVICNDVLVFYLTSFVWPSLNTC